ncbi:MAG: FHA domain-containing protein [Actinomycetes bacterium]
MLPPGTVLGGHRIERLHSVRPAGECYAAQRLADGAPRLVTVLAPDRATPDVLERALAVSERLHSDRPGLAPALEGGVDGGRTWVAATGVDGEDLAGLLRREAPLEPRRAARIAADLADALDRLHAAGLVHGHLEPSSVVVARAADGREHAWVVDVGLGPARAPAAELSRTGSARQSLHALAPEQLQGAPTGPASDQYALACLLTECLTGRPPFPRSSPLATVTDHLRTLPPRLSDVDVRLPAALDVVVARALAKDPRSRFGSCAAFVTAVREVVSGSASDGSGLELAVVGGPASGLAVALPPGHTVVGRSDGADVVVADRLLSRTHVRFTVEDGGVVVADLGSSNGTLLHGKALRRPTAMRPGDVVEVGTSLLTVREPNAQADDVPALVRRAGRGETPDPDDGRVRVRVGWRRGKPQPQAVVLDLARTGAVAVRADAGRRAGVARNVLLQSLVQHAATDLSVALALPPATDDLWSWLALVPHARPDVAPLPGPHVATDSAAAGSLVRRLTRLVGERDATTRDVTDGVVRPLLPRVVVLLDASLVDPSACDVLLRRGPAVQVHPVWFAGVGTTPPDSVDVVLDVSEPAGDLVLRHGGDAPVTGTADAVAPAKARRVASALAQA